MIIKHEFIGSMVEYAPNKLFCGAKPTCMFLIDNWVNIRVIMEPNSSGTDKNWAFEFPRFDEEKFPFVAVCSAACLGLVNVKTGFYQPLVNKKMNADQYGIKIAFAKNESNGISVHFTNRVQDTDGNGRGLI